MSAPPTGSSSGPRQGQSLPHWVNNVSRTIPYLVALFGLIVFGPRMWQFLVIPAVAVAVFGFTAWRQAKGKPRVFIPAFAVLGGLFFWFLLLVLGGGKGWWEVILTSVGMVCLITVENIVPAILMVLFELVILIANIGQLTMMSAGTPAASAGLAIVFLRLLAVMFLVEGISSFRAHPGRATRTTVATATTAATMSVSRVAGPPAVAPAATEGLSAQAAEELRRLSGLVSEGVLSREEFEAKKKKILGL